MRGCTGAGSAQARTLTRRSPPLLALHPCLDLYGLGFSRTLIVLRSSYLFFAPVYLSYLDACLEGGCTVWVGSGFGVLVLIEIEPGLVQTRPVPVWVWGWLDASSFLQMVPCLDASNLDRAGGCKSRLLVLLSFSLPGVRTRRVQGLDLHLEGGIAQTTRVPV